MKKVLRLTELDLINVIKKILVERQDENVTDYIQPYLDSKCVTIKYTSSYIIIDVQSPSYFEEHGFDKNQGLKIKTFLKKNGYNSIGVGEYAKKILSENQKNRLASKWLDSNYKDCDKYLLEGRSEGVIRVFFKKEGKIVMILLLEKNPMVYFGKEISEGIKKFNMDFYESSDFILDWFNSNYSPSAKLSVLDADLSGFEEIYGEEDFYKI
jgi:hypothetical protein